MWFVAGFLPQRDQGSISGQARPGKFIADKVAMEKFFCDYFRSPLSVSLHRYSILIHPNITDAL
jgi:hypothetical protein